MGIMSIPCCDIVVKPPAPRIPGGPILVRAGWYHFLVLSNTGFVSTFIASPPLEAIENPSTESPAFSCDAATTANIGITYNNGVLGLGAYIIGETGITLDSIDGVTLALRGKSVLVKNQTLETENGIYNIDTIGSSTTSWKMIRNSGFPDQRFDDQTIAITDGDINAKLGYYVKDYDAVKGICFGVDAINFSLIKNDYWTDPFVRKDYWKDSNRNLAYPLAETGQRDKTDGLNQGLDTWQCADCTRNVEEIGINSPYACKELSVINIKNYGTIYMAFPGTPCYYDENRMVQDGNIALRNWYHWSRTDSDSYVSRCKGKCAYHNAYTMTWLDFITDSSSPDCATNNDGTFDGKARNINDDAVGPNTMGQVQPFLDMNGRCNELGVTLYYDTGKKDKDGDEIILSSFESPKNLARIAPPGHPLETPELKKAVIDIECGPYHNIVRFNDNTIMAWGLNSMGQTNVPESLLPDWLRPAGVSKHPKINKICSIHAGFSTSAVLFNDGTVLCWGDPDVADEVNTWKHIRTSPIKFLDGIQNQCIGSRNVGFPECLPGEDCTKPENWVPANKYNNGTWNANHDWDREWASHKSRSPAHPHFDLGTETEYVYPVNYNHVVAYDMNMSQNNPPIPEIPVDTNTTGEDFQDINPQYSYRYAQKWPSYDGKSRCAAKGKIKKDFAVAMLRTGQIVTTRKDNAPDIRKDHDLYCRDCNNDLAITKNTSVNYSNRGPATPCAEELDDAGAASQWGIVPCKGKPLCSSTDRLMLPDIDAGTCTTSIRPEGIGCYGSDSLEGNYNPNWAVSTDEWTSAGHAHTPDDGGSLHPTWNKAKSNNGWASLPMPMVRYQSAFLQTTPPCRGTRTSFNKCQSYFGQNDACYTECHSETINGNLAGTPGGAGGGDSPGSFGYFDIPQHMMSFGCVAGTNSVTWSTPAVSMPNGTWEAVLGEMNQWTGVRIGNNALTHGIRMSQAGWNTSRGDACGVCRLNGSSVQHGIFNNLCVLSRGVLFNYPKQDEDLVYNPLSDFCNVGGPNPTLLVSGGAAGKASKSWGPFQITTNIGLLPFPRILDSFIYNFFISKDAGPWLTANSLDHSIWTGPEDTQGQGDNNTTLISRNNTRHLILKPQWFNTFDWVMNAPIYGDSESQDGDVYNEEGNVCKYDPAVSAYDRQCDCKTLCWGKDGENIGNELNAEGMGCFQGGDVNGEDVCDGLFNFNCYAEDPLTYDPKGSITQKPGSGYTLFGPRFGFESIDNNQISQVILTDFSLDSQYIITISPTIDDKFYINVWKNVKVTGVKTTFQRHTIDLSTLVTPAYYEDAVQLKVISDTEILIQILKNDGTDSNFIIISGIYTPNIIVKTISFLNKRSSVSGGIINNDAGSYVDMHGNVNQLNHKRNIVSASLKNINFRIATIEQDPLPDQSVSGYINIYQECTPELCPNYKNSNWIKRYDEENLYTADTNKHIYFILVAKIKNGDIAETSRHIQLNKLYGETGLSGVSLGIKFLLGVNEITSEDPDLVRGNEKVNELLISDDGNILSAGLEYTNTLCFWKLSPETAFPTSGTTDSTDSIVYTNLKLDDNNYTQIDSVKFSNTSLLESSPLWLNSEYQYGVKYFANLVKFNNDNTKVALWGYSNDSSGDGSIEHSILDARNLIINHCNVVERWSLNFGSTAACADTTISSTIDKKIFLWKGSFYGWYNHWDDNFSHGNNTINFNKDLTHAVIISHNDINGDDTASTVLSTPYTNILYVDINNNKYKLITSSVFPGAGTPTDINSVRVNPSNPKLILATNTNDSLIQVGWNFDADGSDSTNLFRYINPNAAMIDMSVDYAEFSNALWPRRMCGTRDCPGYKPDNDWTGGGYYGCTDWYANRENVVNGDPKRYDELGPSDEGCSECDCTATGDKRSRWGWGNRVISYATGRSWSVNLRSLPYNRDRNNASLFLRKPHCQEKNEWGLDEFLKTNNQYTGKAYCHRINNYDNVKIWVTGSMIDPCPPWPLQDWKSELDIDIPLPPLNPNKPDSVMYTVTNELNPNGLTALNGSTGFMNIQPSAQYPSWVPVPAESNYAYKGVWKKIGTTWTWLQGLLRINNGRVDGTELLGISAINYTDMLNITNSVGISGAYQYIKGITLTERTWTEEKPFYNPRKNIFAQSIHFGWDGPDETYNGDSEIKLLYPRTACMELSKYFGSCRSHNGCIQTTKAECKEFDRISRLDSGRGVTWTSQASCNGEPSITLIDPAFGSIGGGEEITITGTDFNL